MRNAGLFLLTLLATTAFSVIVAFTLYFFVIFFSQISLNGMSGRGRREAEVFLIFGLLFLLFFPRIYLAKIYYGMAPKASALFVSFSKWLLGIGSAIIVCGVGGYFLVHFDIVSSFSLGAYNYIYGLVASFGAGLILFTGGLIRAGQKVKSTF